MGCEVWPTYTLHMYDMKGLKTFENYRTFI